ncbi:DUF3820 family protein [Sulfurimonas sp. SAG-AH-194-L11]|nr:DUF3820 family protein [Sulfurimonas sp. SAG-AH-194-L11]MDF1876883.1 DUF3820 family protein [Sulfurimonas sp. SAG-AH-194-L11]
MSKPIFVFTAYKNSFKVLVKNLESLSVPQIQAIQEFVSARKGIFDFSSYSFVIQKRIEFKEFVKIINLSSLDATCVDNPLISQVKPRVSFGQYKGMLYCELPDSYLLWLKENYSGSQKNILKEELNSRSL